MMDYYLVSGGKIINLKENDASKILGETGDMYGIWKIRMNAALVR